MRCKAQTFLGTQCKHLAREGGSYCFRHERIFGTQGSPKKRLRYKIERGALWIGVIGSLASTIAMLIAFLSPLETKDNNIRQIIEELVIVPFDEYISYDNQLQQLAKEQGKTPQQLKSEIDKWVDDIKTPYEKGLGALYLQKYKESEEYLKQSINSSELSLAGAYVQLGNVQLSLNKYNVAIESFQKAIAINPDDAVAHVNLGVVYDEQGKFAEAIASYKTAIEIDDNYAAAYFNLGLVYDKQGKFAEAIAAFKTTTHIDKKFVKAYINLLQVNVKAVASYKSAINLDPNDADAHYNLARVYSFKKEKNLAIESLRRALALDNGLVENTKTDSDFDNIRDTEEFKQLIESFTK